MRIKRENFVQYFEQRGIGYRAKSRKDYVYANPIIETMTLENFMEKIDHPIINRIYTDGDYHP